MNKFKLPAGRGNFSKTGHGVPAPFLQEKNPATYVGPEETKQIEENKKKSAQGYTFQEVKQAKELISKGNFNRSGTAVNVKTGEITKSPYEYRYVKKSNGDEVYKNNKLVKKADPTNKSTSYLGASGYMNDKQSKSNEQLHAGFVQDSLVSQDKKGRLGQIVKASIEKSGLNQMKPKSSAKMKKC